MSYEPPRNAAGFVTNEHPGHPKGIHLEAHRLEEALEFARENGFSGVSVQRIPPYSMENLEFLKDCPWITSVGLQDADRTDLSGLRFGHDSIETLSCGGRGGIRTELDLSKFRKLREYRGQWSPKLRITEDCKNLRSLALWKFNSKEHGLSPLPPLIGLESLELIQGNLKSLKGLGRFPRLARLECYYGTKLESLEGVEELARSPLTWFVCGNCKKIADHDRAAILKSLRVLRYNDCGVIKSLQFLDQLPRLEDFRFVGTDVTSGDMTPLLRLKSAGFTRKKNFSHTPEQINAALAARVLSQ